MSGYQSVCTVQCWRDNSSTNKVPPNSQHKYQQMHEKDLKSIIDPFLAKKLFSQSFKVQNYENSVFRKFAVLRFYDCYKKVDRKVLNWKFFIT